MVSERVVVRVPGKINLQLSVGPLQSDGYHGLATVFQAVSLYDELKIKVSDDPGIRITSEGRNEFLPLNKDNLAYKAAELMAKKFELDAGFDIAIKKEIPISGGMAGGSADAGATIVALDSLFSLGLKRDVME